jgi:type II secretory pathway pseudopilin PulG
MMQNNHNHARVGTRRRGFALIELAAVLALVAALICVLLVAGERARRTAMIGEDLSNLRQIGRLTTNYANDFNDRFSGFSWKAGQSLSLFPDLNNATSDVQATADQAIDIIRRLANRTPSSMPKITSWIPQVLYSHLVLMDYAKIRPAILGSPESASRLFVGNGDKNRLLWISDVDGFEQNKFLPNQPDATIIGGKRWPYSSSYRLPFHFVSTSSGPNAITSAGTWNTYSVPPGATFDAKKLADVAFPSQKVLFHESHGRHHGQRQPYFSVTNGEARVPLLTVDGAADIRATKDGNKGWNPTLPTSLNFIQYTYQPNAWDPPALNGADPCFGSYTYTRSAEKGRDFGGPEVPFQP